MPNNLDNRVTKLEARTHPPEQRGSGLFIVAPEVLADPEAMAALKAEANVSGGAVFLPKKDQDNDG